MQAIKKGFSHWAFCRLQHHLRWFRGLLQCPTANILMHAFINVRNNRPFPSANQRSQVLQKPFIYTFIVSDSQLDRSYAWVQYVAPLRPILFSAERTKAYSVGTKRDGLRILASFVVIRYASSLAYIKDALLKCWTTTFFFESSCFIARDHAEMKAFVPEYVARSYCQLKSNFRVNGCRCKACKTSNINNQLLFLTAYKIGQPQNLRVLKKIW